jgi:hypothetical protein
MGDELTQFIKLEEDITMMRHHRIRYEQMMQQCAVQSRIIAALQREIEALKREKSK